MSKERTHRNKAQVWLRKLGFSQQELRKAWGESDKRNIVARIKRDWEKYPLPYEKIKKILDKYGTSQS